MMNFNFHHLYQKIGKVNFRINFRDRLLEVTVNKEGSSIKLLKGDDLTIKLNGESLTLTTEK